ncbi:MAG: IS256 family transposase [Fimbriimonas sp.]
MAKEIVTLPPSLDNPEGRDLVREMLAEMARMTMSTEVENLCGASYGSRSESRTNSRNGYRERAWDTRAGEISLQVPRLRQGTYLPSFLEPRRTAEKALVSVIQEAYLQGVSTRAVDDLVKALGASGVSKSQVSRQCEEVEARVKEFLARPLEGEFPYVWLDATYLKVRDGGRIVSKAAVLAVGLSSEGRREVLGLKVGHSETQEFWTEFLRSLLDRGLRGVRLVVSDCHAGLRRSIERCMGCAWQRCRVHFMRNVLSKVTKGRKEMVAALVRTAFAQESLEAARVQWSQMEEGLAKDFAAVSELMREAREDVLAHMAHPKELWPMLASNNGLERLNRELKRRADVVQIFPNENSVVRLMGAILMEQHDEWQVTRKQVSVKSLTGRDTRDDALLARGGGG